MTTTQFGRAVGKEIKSIEDVWESPDLLARLEAFLPGKLTASQIELFFTGIETNFIRPYQHDARDKRQQSADDSRYVQKNVGERVIFGEF